MTRDILPDDSILTLSEYLELYATETAYETRYRVLLALDADTPESVADLADETGIDASDVRDVLNALRDVHGLVARVEGPDGVAWRATPIGNRISEQVLELAEREWRISPRE